MVHDATLRLLQCIDSKGSDDFVVGLHRITGGDGVCRQGTSQTNNIQHSAKKRSNLGCEFIQSAFALNTHHPRGPLRNDLLRILEFPVCKIRGNERMHQRGKETLRELL